MKHINRLRIKNSIKWIDSPEFVAAEEAYCVRHEIPINTGLYLTYADDFYQSAEYRQARYKYRQRINSPYPLDKSL